MLKKSYVILSLARLAAGCTKEVYLQAVPCVEGNCDPKPVVALVPEPCGCPELIMQTQTISYQMVDVPSPATTYVYQPCGAKRNCRTVCREVKVK
ncbi:MAG: hypothetical protein J6B00_02080 [Alphaproteobacteria bacterium]|nr:hypothetical protein [Alphaproteobacteria bacterium]